MRGETFGCGDFSTLFCIISMRPPQPCLFLLYSGYGKRLPIHHSRNCIKKVQYEYRDCQQTCYIKKRKGFFTGTARRKNRSFAAGCIEMVTKRGFARYRQSDNACAALRGFAGRASAYRGRNSSWMKQRSCFWRFPLMRQLCGLSAK